MMPTCAPVLSRVQLFLTLWTGACHGISQARILEWAAISSSRDLPDPGIEPGSLALAGDFFTTEPPGKTLLSTLSWKSKGH